MIDIYGSPLPLKAVAADPAPTWKWALAAHSVRVHITWSNTDRTFCDLLVAEMRDMIGPGHLFCIKCAEEARTIR